MDKVKKVIKKIIAVLVICTVFIGSFEGLRYVIVDDTSAYTRITMHEFYNQDNIDVLFMGASHCYRAINPDIVDDKFEGVNSFNLGSSGQKLDTTYLLMQEAVERYDIKEIYVELSLTVAKGTEYKRDEVNSAYIVTDYLKPSIRKYMYLLNITGTESYATSMLLARRDWENIFDAEYIGELLEKKSSDIYKNYRYDYVSHNEEQYVGRGHVANNYAVPNGVFFESRCYKPINTEDITTAWVDTIQKMIKYCDKNDVKLTFFLAPETSYLLAGYGNQDDYSNYIRELLADEEVRFIDFNCMREEYWADTSEYFRDDNHLNKVGSEIFTNIFCDYINGDITDEELFYDSVLEKYKALAPAVYGAAYEVVGNNKRCKIVSNKDDMKYRVTVVPEGDVSIVITDFENDKYFKIPKDIKGTLKVEYWMPDNPETISVAEIPFK